MLVVVGRIPPTTKPLLHSLLSNIFYFQLFVSSDTVICDSDRIQARSFDCKSFITLFLFISFNLISWSSASPNIGKFSHMIKTTRYYSIFVIFPKNISYKYFLNYCSAGNIVNSLFSRADFYFCCERKCLC